MSEGSAILTALRRAVAFTGLTIAVLAWCLAIGHLALRVYAEVMPLV